MEAAGGGVGTLANATKSAEELLQRALLTALLRDPGCEQDRGRLEGLLRDFAPGQPGGHYRVLLVAQDFVSELRSTAGPTHVIRQQLHRRLTVEGGFADTLATWALDSWVAALEMGQPSPQLVEALVSTSCRSHGRPLELRRGRFGHFLACPEFPDCRVTRALTRDTAGQLTVSTFKRCPACGLLRLREAGSLGQGRPAFCEACGHQQQSAAPEGS